MTRASAAVLAALALVAAGCGGGGGAGSLPEGAGRAPDSAPAFTALKTDASSEEWQNARKLAAKFPAVAPMLDTVEKYRSAFGPELDVVWLDFANGGNDVVALTKPSEIDKLKALLGADTSTADAGDGWLALADDPATLDRFKQEASGDKLDSDDEFEHAFGKLDSEAVVRAWVRGAPVQAALDRALESGGAAPGITHDVGDLKSISGEGHAETDGARVSVYGVIDPAPDLATFSPSLPDSTPGGAVLYVSTTELDAPTRVILRMVGESNPNFDTQLSQVEGVFGLTLKDDIYPLLKGESALAVYRGGRIPPILFQQKVDDEKKADGLLRRFSSIASLAGGVGVDTQDIEGTTVQKLTFESANVTIWDGVVKGRVFVTNAEELAREMVTHPEHTLAEDELFRSAREAAGLPDKVAAFAYGDLQNGLPYIFRVVEEGGSVIPPAARANTKPLHSAFVYLVKDGDALRMSGFVTIK